MMARILKLGLLLCAVLLTCMAGKAQDPQFTQFFANPVYLSPSYAGASQGHRVVLSYRDQWSVVPNMFRTLSASYDINISTLRSGLGVFVLGDLAGSGHLGTILGGAVYSYSVSMNDSWSFRPGIGVYFVQRSINYSRLIWGDQLNNDPPAKSTVQELGKSHVYDIDVSTSVLFHTTNAWVGATWDHMLRPKNSFFTEKSRTPYRFTAFGGYRFVLQSLYRRGVNQSVSVASNVRWQGRFGQVDLGGYWYRYPILLGVWYRGLPIVKRYFGSDAVAFMVGCRFGGLQVAYSYDLTVSRLEPGTGGSHEISLTYEAKITPKKRKYKAPICPPY